jgi:hypothetical protein
MRVDPEESELACLPFPSEGVLRVHRAPTQLRPREGGTGPDRFDDPQDEYRVRYFGSTIRGCLLEVLDHFRGVPLAEEALSAHTTIGIDILEEEPAGLVPGRWLALQRVTTARLVTGRLFVDVADSDVLAFLNQTAGVQRVLRSTTVRSAFGNNVRLDMGTICAVGPAGRAITQAVSEEIHLHPSRPSGITYLTRFDKGERCWAVFEDRAKLEFSDPESLDDWDSTVRVALRSVANRYGLTLPADWR